MIHVGVACETVPLGLQTFLAPGGCMVVPVLDSSGEERRMEDGAEQRVARLGWLTWIEKSHENVVSHKELWKCWVRAGSGTPPDKAG